MSSLSFSRFFSLCVVLSVVVSVVQMTSSTVVQQNSDFSGKECDSDQLRSNVEMKEIEDERTEQPKRDDDGQGTPVRRVRRASDGSSSVGRQWTNGRFDPAPYWRTVRDFMRFGRSHGNDDDVICFPVAIDDRLDETSAEGDRLIDGKGAEMMMTGSEPLTLDESWMDRSVRDQGSYDYSGKPFMRFGKRFMRFGRGFGGDQPEVVCFRHDEVRGKRFMRFGKAVAREQGPDVYSDMVDLKRFMRFGKSIPLDSTAENIQSKEEQIKI